MGLCTKSCFTPLTRQWRTRKRVLNSSHVKPNNMFSVSVVEVGGIGAEVGVAAGVDVAAPAGVAAGVVVAAGGVVAAGVAVAAGVGVAAGADGAELTRSVLKYATAINAPARTPNANAATMAP